MRIRNEVFLSILYKFVLNLISAAIKPWIEKKIHLLVDFYICLQRKKFISKLIWTPKNNDN